MLRDLLEDASIEHALVHERTDLHKEEGTMYGIEESVSYKEWLKKDPLDSENKFTLKFISYMINIDGVQCAATPDKVCLALHHLYNILSILDMFLFSQVCLSYQFHSFRLKTIKADGDEKLGPWLHGAIPYYDTKYIHILLTTLPFKRTGL